MSIPTHDITCITKAFPTNCPDCTEPVWFFSCSCGSKLFFNQLGYPWEQHVCRKYQLQQTIKLIKDSERMSDEEIYRQIENIEKKHGRRLDSTTEEMLTDILGKRKFSLTITDHEPVSDTDFSGRVMEINRPVNIFKRLGYDPAAPLAKMLLGKIGEQTWAHLTIRSAPDSRNHAIQYSLLVPMAYLQKSPIRQGQTIAGVARITHHRKGKFLTIESHIVS